MVDRAGTMTRAKLAEALQERAGFSSRKADLFVGGIIERISEALENGEQVKIANFGTFLLREKAERSGRNPKTGQEHVVTARRVIAFRPSADLRAKVARPLHNDGQSI